jgi:hypothetical protein
MKTFRAFMGCLGLLIFGPVIIGLLIYAPLPTFVLLVFSFAIWHIVNHRPSPPSSGPEDDGPLPPKEYAP